MTSSNAKVKEARWKTHKQLFEIFGDETEEMKKCLPRHPIVIVCGGVVC